MSANRRTLRNRRLTWTGLNASLRRVLWLLREAADLDAYLVLSRDGDDPRKLCCHVVAPSVGRLLFDVCKPLKESDLAVEVYPVGTWLMRRNSILRNWLADWRHQELVLAVSFGGVIAEDFEMSGEAVEGRSFEILVGLKDSESCPEEPMIAGT